MGVRVHGAREPVFRWSEGRGRLSAALCCGALTGLPRATSPATTSACGLTRAEVLPGCSGSAAEQRVGAVRELVERFCEDVPPARVEPSHEELEALWQRCSHMRRGEVASALADQLSSASSEADWRTQVRALHFLAHLFSQGQAARATAQAAMESAEDLIRHLAKDTDSECSDAAARALLLSQLTEAHIADLGGLLSFTAEARPAQRRPAPAEEHPPLDLLDFSSSQAAPSAPSKDLISLDDPTPTPPAPALAPAAAAPARPARPLEPAPAAPPPRPLRFDIAGGDLGGENHELEGMFTFEKRQVMDIPVPTDAYMEKHFQRLPDPFASLAEHVRRHL